MSLFAILMKWLDRYSTKPVFVGIFLLCAAPTGLLMAALTPPGQAPDEPNHLARAAGLLNGQVLIIRHKSTNPGMSPPRFDASVNIDQGLRDASFGQTTLLGNVHKVSLSDWLAMLHAPPDHVRTSTAIPNTATYFPAAYLPAAIGLALGLALHASPFICFMLARLGMLLAFLGIGTLAIRVTAYGEALLLAVLLLPMTLFLAGTLNEDGLLIGMACFVAAALTRPAAPFTTTRLFGLAVLVLLLASKPPYFPLLGLVLLPLRWSGLWRRCSEALLASVPVIIWLALILHFTVVPFGKPPYHPGPLWAGDPAVLLDHTDAAANLHILLHRPARMITLPLHTQVLYGVQKFREMIGVLGVLQIQFSDLFYLCWLGCLGIAWLGPFWTGWREPDQPVGATILTAAFVLGLLVLAYWLIMLSMYLNWTNVGEDFIDGMQGRYSILLLPLLIFAVPSRRGRSSLLPALPVLVMGISDIGLLPLKFVTFFYLH